MACMHKDIWTTHSHCNYHSSTLLSSNPGEVEIKVKLMLMLVFEDMRGTMVLMIILTYISVLSLHFTALKVCPKSSSSLRLQAGSINNLKVSTLLLAETTFEYKITAGNHLSPALTDSNWVSRTLGNWANKKPSVVKRYWPTDLPATPTRSREHWLARFLN